MPHEASKENRFKNRYQRHLRLLRFQGKSQKTIDAYSRGYAEAANILTGHQDNAFLPAKAFNSFKTGGEHFYGIVVFKAYLQVNVPACPEKDAFLEDGSPAAPYSKKRYFLIYT